MMIQANRTMDKSVRARAYINKECLDIQSFDSLQAFLRSSRRSFSFIFSIARHMLLCSFCLGTVKSMPLISMHMQIYERLLEIIKHNTLSDRRQPRSVSDGSTSSTVGMFFQEFLPICGIPQSDCKYHSYALLREPSMISPAPSR